MEWDWGEIQLIWVKIQETQQIGHFFLMQPSDIYPMWTIPGQGDACGDRPSALGRCAKWASEVRSSSVSFWRHHPMVKTRRETSWFLKSGEAWNHTWFHGWTMPWYWDWSSITMIRGLITVPHNPHPQLESHEDPHEAMTYYVHRRLFQDAFNETLVTGHASSAEARQLAGHLAPLGFSSGQAAEAWWVPGKRGEVTKEPWKNYGDSDGIWCDLKMCRFFSFILKPEHFETWGSNSWRSTLCTFHTKNEDFMPCLWGWGHSLLGWMGGFPPPWRIQRKRSFLRARPYGKFLAPIRRPWESRDKCGRCRDVPLFGCQKLGFGPKFKGESSCFPWSHCCCMAISIFQFAVYIRPNLCRMSCKSTVPSLKW